MGTIRTDTDIEIFKSYLLSKTLADSTMKAPSTYTSATSSRQSTIYKSPQFAQSNDRTLFSSPKTTPSTSRRMSLPGGSQKLRSMVYRNININRQFSFMDFESYQKSHSKAHAKSFWQKLFSKSTVKDSNAELVKENGVLEILSSKVASLYFLAFLLERDLESTALFIWDCLKTENEAPLPVLVQDYCLKDSPLPLPSLPEINYESIASMSKNRDDLILSISRCISSILISAYELFLQSTLFLSYESLGKNGVYSKSDQDESIKTLNRYLTAYTLLNDPVNTKISKRLNSIFKVDNKPEEVDFTTVQQFKV